MRRRYVAPNPKEDKEFSEACIKRLGDPKLMERERPPPHHEFWLVLDDPCGLFCALFTHFVVQFVNYVTVFRVVIPWFMNLQHYRIAFVNIFCFEVVICMITWSHLKCMLSDPGTVPRHWSKKAMEVVQSRFNRWVTRGENPQGYHTPLPWCKKCENYKPAHTHHCSYCGSCIEEFDHHCPWMNNCVGKNNHKFFMLFLLYVGTGSGYAITMTILRLYFCYKSDAAYMAAANCDVKMPATIILFIISIVFSLLFMLFVTCMGYEQLEEIGDMTTMVEKKKGMRPERMGVWRGLEKKFREPFSIRWFLPIQYYECKKIFPPLSRWRKEYGTFSTVLGVGCCLIFTFWFDKLAHFYFRMGKRARRY